MCRYLSARCGLVMTGRHLGLLRMAGSDQILALAPGHSFKLCLSKKVGR